MIVVDASAVLALVNREAGWQVLASAAVGQDATISAVNYTEVIQKCARQGVAAEVVDTLLGRPPVGQRIRGERGRVSQR